MWIISIPVRMALALVNEPEHRPYAGRDAPVNLLEFFSLFLAENPSLSPQAFHSIYLNYRNRLIALAASTTSGANRVRKASGVHSLREPAM